MIGMVLVTHGGLAQEFLAALEHVVGPQSQVAVISIGPDDDMEARRREILDAVARVDDGAGVAVLTDMFGGTPSNLAISVMEEAHGRHKQSGVEVIAGVNLPMLIKLASVRDEKPLDEVVVEAQEAGRKYINVASALLQSDD
jgi:PTS system mannose-specific IIA component